MRHFILAGALACLTASPILAEAIPAGSRLDHRVRETRHVDGQVYKIRVALTRATTVELEPGEQIVSIVAGDTESFQFQTVPGDRVVAIKPTARGVRTNATIYTNRRSYYLTLEEGNAPFYVVRFTFPRRANQAGTAPRRTAAKHSYGVSERNAITPSQVWDDGSFTYFRFPAGAPVPAIFRVTSGRERSVNSQVVEDRVVRVSGTSLQWVVRMGDIEVCIVELF
ncbi:TrbG/VirB9 family P-type conjugative transfer protein [Jannaschia aquimarina]|uniref:VirB9 protein n=1 Tax=Jannaschia aquimarina TaxID=935700 RepID=A0A0D1ELB9_9RHOB|nr:TrbG/VirB9 family P-type conjugative transfer protein [Jannaschia aquimarina]KIT16570.1 Type IV secretion system protein virB9 precursor [Jannaschia aquimarina]SNT41697.1 type IV secretion system protein VirB9 [Jannaschia aquimarina]